MHITIIFSILYSTFDRKAKEQESRWELMRNYMTYIPWALMGLTWNKSSPHNCGEKSMVIMNFLMRPNSWMRRGRKWKEFIVKYTRSHPQFCENFHPENLLSLFLRKQGKFCGVVGKICADRIFLGRQILCKNLHPVCHFSYLAALEVAGCVQHQPKR